MLPNTDDDGEAFLTLVQHAAVFSFGMLNIERAIGEGGWTALAEALRLLPPLVLDDYNPDNGDGEEGPQPQRGFLAIVVGDRNFMLHATKE